MAALRRIAYNIEILIFVALLGCTAALNTALASRIHATVLGGHKDAGVAVDRFYISYEFTQDDGSGYQRFDNVLCSQSEYNRFVVMHGDMCVTPLLTGPPVLSSCRT